MAGQVVIAPPGALNDRWSRRLPDRSPPWRPAGCASASAPAAQRRAAAGDLRPRRLGRAHLTTIRELEPTEVWITHGREEALKHWCLTHQIKACELNLVGYEDEDD